MDGDPELVEIHRLHAAVDIEMGKPMAGEVRGEEEVFEVKEIKVRSVGGDEDGRPVFPCFVVGIPLRK